MRYGSLFSGIEAPTAAWHSLGWEPAWFAEIERFPSAVLAHHYPSVPNLGDVTKVDWNAVESVDLIVFGSPCQSFSVAGKRLGLDDPRGNLALYALSVVDRLRPDWFVFENVPGLLSSDGGRDFGAFLGAVGECGYQCAWRILDAQHFGVPQRRRRVFVVGYLGDWRRACAVLFERSSLSGHPPPSREAGEGIAAGTAYSINADCFDRTGEGSGGTARERAGFGIDEGLAYSLRAKRPDAVAHTLRADGFDASEDGTGRGTPLVFDTTQMTSKANRSNPKPGDPCHPLAAGAHAPAIAFANTAGDTALGLSLPGVPPLTTRNGDPGNVHVPGMAVRRITTTEAERLMGFPDGYTAVPYRGKPAADGPRYRSLGNSMAVPVVRWIGARIQALHTRSEDDA